MYCLKCRRVIENENITTATSNNGRLMRRGQCVICGKLRLPSSNNDATGGSFLNTLVNKLPFEMHLPGQNFYGSRTKLYKRLNPDGMPKERCIPINSVEKAAYHHDFCYSKHDDTKTRNEVCDKAMLGELNVIVNSSLRERIDKSIVGKLINAKVNFGLGAPIKANTTLKVTDELAEELYKPVTIQFQRRRVCMNCIDAIWASDLIDMQAFSKKITME